MGGYFHFEAAEITLQMTAMFNVCVCVCVCVWSCRGQSKDKSNSDNGEDDDADDGDGESLPLTNAKYSTVESSGVVSVTDANEQQKSLRLSAGQGKEREKDKQPPRVPLSNSVASLTVGPALLLGGNGGVAVSPRKNKKDDGWKEVGRRCVRCCACFTDNHAIDNFTIRLFCILDVSHAVVVLVFYK